MPATPAHSDTPQLDWISDSHLRVRLGDGISSTCLERVRASYEALRGAKLPGLRDVTPAYASLLLRFDPLTLDPDATMARVRESLVPVASTPLAPARTVEIPVCYDPACAPDLADVAARCSLLPSEMVALHSSAAYTVAFIGFAPGFPYLHGLPEQLNVPRLDAPRPRVPAGSVAIAGDQAGIYPHATPGGWRIIGRTPLRLFDASASPPSLLTMGNRVRFVPIMLDEFRAKEQASR
jgi:KipI family sensor histidine kinase inhibitor